MNTEIPNVTRPMEDVEEAMTVTTMQYVRMWGRHQILTFNARVGPATEEMVKNALAGTTNQVERGY